MHPDLIEYHVNLITGFANTTHCKSIVHYKPLCSEIAKRLKEVASGFGIGVHEFQDVAHFPESMRFDMLVSLHYLDFLEPVEMKDVLKHLFLSVNRSLYLSVTPTSGQYSPIIRQASEVHNAGWVPNDKDYWYRSIVECSPVQNNLELLTMAQDDGLDLQYLTSMTRFLVNETSNLQAIREHRESVDAA